MAAGQESGSPSRDILLFHNHWQWLSSYGRVAGSSDRRRRRRLFSERSASDGGRSSDVYTTSSWILEAVISSALNEFHARFRHNASIFSREVHLTIDEVQRRTPCSAVRRAHDPCFRRRIEKVQESFGGRWYGQPHG